MKKFIFIPMTALLLIGQSMNGTKAQDADSGNKKPEVPEAVQNLKKFVGDWQSNGMKLTMEGKTYTVDYSVSCKETADGSGISADEWFTDPKLGKMKGADLVGYDANEGKIKWYSVDNMGNTNEHAGKWETPDHLYVVYTGMHKGKKLVDRMDFLFKGPNELDFKGVTTLNGVVTGNGEGVFIKK